MSVPSLRSLRTVRRRRAQRPLYIALGGLAVVAVAGLLGYIALSAPSGVPLRDYQTLYAEVPDPGNLQRHNEVRTAGVTIGQVLEIQSRGGRGVVELKLDPGTAPFPRDTEVLVRGKGLLGARYVELRPGTSEQTLEEGATIKGDSRSLTYGVPDVLETFDRETRGALGEMMGEFGRGLFARGRELNDAIRAYSYGQGDFNQVADEILARPGAAREFIPSLERAAAAFDDAREELARAMGPTARGLEPFVEEREAVREILEEAPSTLSEMESGLGEGRRLLTAARDLSTAVSDTLPAAPPGLRAATAMLRESPVPLQRTSLLLDALGSAVPDLLRITDSLSPNLDPLRRAFDDLQQLTAGATPYNCDIENFSENLRSVLRWDQGPGGPIGPISGFNATLIFGPEAAGNFTRLPERAESRYYRYEPEPPPCKYSPGPTYQLSGLPAEEGGR